MLAGITIAFSSTYCVRLDPATVCTTTNDCYNTSDCTVDCDGSALNIVEQCAGTSGTADDSVVTNIIISTTGTNNKHCWCATTRPVASKWVMRYTYPTVAQCLKNCARGCRNALIFNNPDDIHFRTVLYSNLIG